MRSAPVLVAVIAAAAVAGIAISSAQRPPGPAPPPAVTPSAAPTPIPRGPISGIGFSVVDDPAASQVILFGGVDNYANTWIWTGSQWVLAAPAMSPPGRVDAAGAYDPQTKAGAALRRTPRTRDQWTLAQRHLGMGWSDLARA